MGWLFALVFALRDTLWKIQLSVANRSARPALLSRLLVIVLRGASETLKHMVTMGFVTISA